MNIIIIIAAVLISLAIGILIGMVYRKKVAESKIQGAENEAKRLIDLAKKEAQNLKKEEKEKARGRKERGGQTLRTQEKHLQRVL